MLGILICHSRNGVNGQTHTSRPRLSSGLFGFKHARRLSGCTHCPLLQDPAMFDVLEKDVSGDLPSAFACSHY